MQKEIIRQGINFLDISMICGENILSKDIKPEESLLGFRKLHELMNVQKEGFEKSGKVFAVRHTEDFIKRIDEMIEKLEESETQTE